MKTAIPDWKNRLIGIALLCILTLPVVVTYGWLQYHKAMIKKEVKWRIIAGMEKEELVLLKFSKEDSRSKLRWEHALEFEFNKHMYDIVESKVIGDTTYYWCWWDTEETKISKRCALLVSDTYNADPQKNKQQQQLFSFYKNLYFSNYSSVPNVRHYRVKCNVAIFNTLIHSLHFPPPTPPPRIS